MIGVVAHQSRQVERHRQPAATVLQQIFVALVRLFRRSEAGKLAHGKQLPAIAGRVNATRIRRLPGESQVLLIVPIFRKVRLRVEPPYGKSRNRGEPGPAMLVEIYAASSADWLFR